MAATKWTQADIDRVTTKAEMLIGIDSGTKTGIAVWDRLNRRFIQISTVKIHQAFEIVRTYASQFSVKVVVEDARQVRFKTDAAKMKGAGSVCRGAKIWEDFLTDQGVAFEMVRPTKAITKWSAEQFKTTTGFKQITSSHGRDAGMLVWGK